MSAKQSCEALGRGADPRRAAARVGIAVALRPFEEARVDATRWDRMVDNVTGAQLLYHLPDLEWAVSYWRRGNAEVT